MEELYNGSVRLLQITEHTKCLLCQHQGLIYGHGSGKQCKRCRGSGQQNKNRFIRVNIRKGMRHEQRIIYEGEGIRELHKIPGHLIVTLEQKSHSIFERKGNDLFLVMRIAPQEVQLGCERIIPTLDGRRLPITITTFEGISGTHTVLGEGMPILNNHLYKGQLFIKYDIV